MEANLTATKKESPRRHHEFDIDKFYNRNPGIHIGLDIMSK